MRKHNMKHFLLAIVAVILILMMSVGVTFSWIDDIKLVEFQNDDLVSEGAPLKTGVDINSTVEISSDTSIINFGNMLDYNDLTYTYVEGGAQKRHTKYEGGSNAPDWSDINKKKGYFYESGDMHLSGCYGDGESFFFPMRGGNQSGYREGNKDDENVNYISFTTKVSSPYANIDFWFRNEPTICVKGTNTKIENARYAIIVDGEAHVYSSTGSALTCNSGLSGTTAVSGVRRTTDYVYNSDTNTNQERGKNSNTLFSIAKGETVNMTVKIWLQDGYDTNITASDINFQLASSWAYNRKLWIEDKTTNGGGGSWLNDNNAKLYVTFPEFLYELSTSVGDWPNLANTDNAPFYDVLTDSSTGKKYVTVPLVYNNEKMILYRCNSTYWNNSGSGAQKRSDYQVYCWNWWQTYTPNTYVNSTYTLYGGSMDSTAKGYFAGDMGAVTNKGYGTWGEVEEIKVYSSYNGSDLASKGNGKALYIVDFTDEDASGERYIYEMYRSGTGSGDPWKTYVPATSSKIQFRYFGGASGLTWGYSSWGGANPQRRPLASTGLYPNNAKTYQFAAIFNSTNGWGYWKDSTNNIEYDKVYLVKNDIFWQSSNLYANMYDDNSHGNADWPGVQMTRMKNASNADVTWSDGLSPVYQSDPARSGASTIYNHIKFNDGNSNYDSATKTGELDVFPGCFYSPANSKWYGSLDDKGRTASESASGGDSGDEGTGSISGYTIETDIVFKINNVSYDAYRKNDSSNSYKVRIPLVAGDNWTTVLNGSINYGREQSGQSISVPNSNDMDYILKRYHSNNFSLNNTSTAGNFICEFEFNNGNTNEIKLKTCVKEG